MLQRGVNVALLSCVVCAGALWGQTSSGSVVVNVQDPTGAAVAAAQVTVTDETTGVNTSQVSSSQGVARFVSVKPAVYTVSATAAGFKKYSQTHVTVNVDESVTLNFQLELGAVTESVEVVGSTPLLQTEHGELGQVIGEKQLTDLPLNGRNPISLALLSPGVIPGSGFGNSPLLLANLSINGSHGGAAQIQVDGAPITVPENSPGTFATATLPSVERVQEFKVQTNSFSAEFGRTAGGIVNVVIKSGTNQVHGSVYEFLRNSTLDANNFFLNRAGKGLGTFQRNQYGFTFGGPVVIPGVYNGHNRTFIFGGFEGLRENSQGTSQTTIPTAAELAGDFSRSLNARGQAVTIYDPLTTTQSGSGYARSPFPGNVIPGNRLDPVARRALSYYPKPNLPGAGPALLNNYIASGLSRTDDNNFDIRVDHQVSARNNLFGRASYRDFTQINPNYYGTIGQPGPASIPRPGHSGSLNDVFNITPGLLNEFSYGYARLFTRRQSFSYGEDITKDLGLPPALAQNSAYSGFPVFTIPGYGAIGESFSARYSLESHSLDDHLTWIHGRHSMKFGMQTLINRTNFFQGNMPAGAFTFSAGFTQGPDPTRGSPTAGTPVASMLLGLADSGLVTHDGYVSTQSPYFAWFLQDDIKLSRTFTVNIGLRYDLEIPRSERYNRLSVFDPTVANPLSSKVPGSPDLRGGLEFIGVNRGKQYDTSLRNFGPRFGFAWQGLKSTVVRGGYAIFYPPSSKTAAGTVGGAGNAGFASLTPFIGTLDGGLTPQDTLSNPFPRGFELPPGSSQGLLSFLGLNFVTPDLYDGSPYVQQWNLNVQRELLPGLLVEAGYAGARGTRLSAVVGPLNQLTPAQMQSGNALLASTPNPFYGIITDPASPLSLRNTTVGQLLRPFPEFGAISVEKAAIGNSTYHSLQVRVDRRFRQGITFLAAYTASKLIDDISTSGTGLLPPYAFIQNWYNRKAERSPAVYDVPQRFVFSTVAEMPFGRHRKFGAHWNRALDLVAGGWQWNGILTFSSGVPLILANALNNSGALNNGLGDGAPTGGVQRPNDSGQSAKLGGPIVDRLNQYFNTAVFSQPAPFTFGNTARTLPDVRSPGIRNLDLALFKNFPVNEKGAEIQVRAESFNLTNTPQFAAPATTFGAANFGVISGQGNNPRQIQFGLRVVF